MKTRKISTIILIIFILNVVAISQANNPPYDPATLPELSWAEYITNRYTIIYVDDEGEYYFVLKDGEPYIVYLPE